MTAAEVNGVHDGSRTFLHDIAGSALEGMIVPQHQRIDNESTKQDRADNNNQIYPYKLVLEYCTDLAENLATLVLDCLAQPLLYKIP